MSEELISVEEFRKLYINRRGKPVTHSYIYRLIREFEGKVFKDGVKVIRLSLPFEYREVKDGNGVMIVKGSLNR